MTWDEIRREYAGWLVVEAIGAYTQGSQRIIPDLRVVGTFGDDWQAAWEEYKRLHTADKEREHYPIHTSREALNIGVIDAFGRVISS
jgi:hypothetical protein